MRLLFIAAACFSAMASSALAQPGPPPPSTVEQRQAQAQQMITDGAAADIFVHEDHPPAITIRHPRSGLLCRFLFGEPGQSLSIVPSTSLGVAHGDDVACASSNQLSAVTIYATRRPDQLNSDQALEQAVAALRTVHANAQPFDLSTLQTPPGVQARPAPPSSTAAFTINANGQELFTRVSVYVRDGWTYKMRFTSPYPETNMLAEMLWNTALNDLAPSPVSAP